MQGQVEEGSGELPQPLTQDLDPTQPRWGRTLAIRHPLLG